jgi:AsmA protein
VDVSGAEPKFSESLNVAGLRVQPFLTQLIGVKQIVATGAVKLDLNAHGSRPNEIVKALTGSGDIRFTDGYIRGVDLAAVARVLQSLLTAQILTGAVGDNAKTPFGAMGGTFTVANGVLRTNDLKLTNPTLEMSGKGDVDLPAHVLDIHFEPKANKGIPGIKLVDVGVPFTVKGRWNHPNYIPDVGGLAKNIVQKLGGDAASPLKSLFGLGKSKTQ